MKSQYSISIPKDADGRVARKCPNHKCNPGYFKVKLGTGITEGQTHIFCPYCHERDESGAFISKEQERFIKDFALKEAQKDIQKMFKKTFRSNSSIKYTPGSLPHIRNPREEELQRSLICSQCGLDHAVFGLATWCSDCGKDIFITHFEKEFEVIKTMLSDLERREENLGARIVAKDIENCLEDVVTIFEAVLKIILRKYLHQNGQTETEIHNILSKKIRNGFQNPSKAKDLIKKFMEKDLFDGIEQKDESFLNATFEKRHPITHNLGIIDRKYLEKVIQNEKEGSELKVSKNEILKAIEISMLCLSQLYEKNRSKAK